MRQLRRVPRLQVALRSSLLIVVPQIAGACKQESMDGQRVFQAEAWTPGEVGGVLFKTSADGEILFLKGLPWRNVGDLEHQQKTEPQIGAFGGIIYRYDARAKRLEPVGEDNWKIAPGEVWGSLSSMSARDDGVMVHPRSNLLLYHDRVIKTAGKTALASRLSPKADLVAVLSADGSRASSLMPFAGQGGASGQHYHELFQLPEMKPVGNPTPLPLITEHVAVYPFWSSDQRYVVYVDARYTEVCVVKIQLLKGPNP